MSISTLEIISSDLKRTRSTTAIIIFRDKSKKKWAQEPCDNEWLRGGERLIHLVGVTGAGEVGRQFAALTCTTDSLCGRSSERRAPRVNGDASQRAAPRSRSQWSRGKSSRWNFQPVSPASHLSIVYWRRCRKKCNSMSLLARPPDHVFSTATFQTIALQFLHWRSNVSAGVWIWLMHLAPCNSHGGKSANLKNEIISLWDQCGCLSGLRGVTNCERSKESECGTYSLLDDSSESLSLSRSLDSFISR